MRLKDKVAVVTGSTRGLGRAIAEKYASEGAKVVLIDRSGDGLEKTITEMKEKYSEVYGYVMDVTNRSQVQEVFTKVVEDLGTVDILVNNAGITADAQLYKMSDDQWDNVINVNLTGVYNCSKAAVNIMRTKEYGKIINISSVVGLYGNFGQTNYAATKSGVIGMTKSLAKELGRKNVNVNAVCPGFIETEMTAIMPEKVLAMMKEKAPLNRLGKPDDIANACLFLASEESSFVTGTVLSVDGGIVL
ncbi:3-oxoacyl-ACP reductase FabG [Alkaliphilus peptidifermentans]|uniref:3-oxoacyl-[acyl-carrier-protein] reductase n=1 Tax=Alkaliphilus peptidifermentans DSM 18978 TaxID=1120976 RepID=A0A1G5ABQ0_9FIRM|nr:3-oxoacyl-ACP reductase FabG [Alkaliphilus peptidifermentans]SCX75314.1 3-oxoacyl-[acyl-carrier-protein] reductase [Alkaliphilus peptidifermentans DSM 18978]